jgi:hypothetical protein
MKKVMLSSLFIASVFGATLASADVLKLRTHPGNQFGTDTRFLQIDGAATSVTFSGAGFVAVTFSAECRASTSGNAGTPGTGGPNSWVDIDILVDGVEAAPSAGDFDAFCSDPNYWGMQSMTVRADPVGAGNHTVQVRVKNNVAGGQWWIGDSTIMIQR